MGQKGHSDLYVPYAQEVLFKRIVPSYTEHQIEHQFEE